MTNDNDEFNMPRTRSGAYTQPQKRGRGSNLQPTPVDQEEPGITSLPEDLHDEVTSTVQTEALINHLMDQLKRELYDHDRRRVELQAENARCKEEAERLRQELEREKETLSKERDTWNKERDRWQTKARQLRAELNAKGGDIEDLQRNIEELHTRFEDSNDTRRAGLEAIVADTVRFWQSSQAAQELLVRQTQRVLLVQLDQIMREETRPRSIADIVEEFVRHDDGIPT